jgi:hypothetical protein
MFARLAGSAACVGDIPRSLFEFAREDYSPFIVYSMQWLCI